MRENSSIYERIPKTRSERILPDGRKVVIEGLSTLTIDRRISPESVEYHEACHALAQLLLGKGVRYLTNIPEGDSAGHTAVDSLDPVVAAAAEAMGCVGTGHDLMMIEVLGHDVHAAIEGARRLLRGRETEILAIATMLREKRTLGGTEAWKLACDAEEIQRGGEVYLVTIEHPDGTQEIQKQHIGLEDMLTIDVGPQERPHASF